MKKIVLIVSGVVLLAALTAVSFFILRAAGNLRDAHQVQKTEEEDLDSCEAEDKKPQENKDKESAMGEKAEDLESGRDVGAKKADDEETDRQTGGETADKKADSARSEEAEEGSPAVGSKGADHPADAEGAGRENYSADTEKEDQEKCPECGALQVIGTNLCDSEGNQVQLKGISTHGLAWFPDYVNEALFKELHEQWNVNVIRLAMYTGENGGYCTGGDQGQLKQLIRDGVEYASGQNMYVIIDWHILSDGDPNTYKEEAKNFFGEMSAEFADRENILYEICNEPNGGTDWSRVKEYAQEIIPVIRENDEDAVILVGTPNWCQFLDQAAADPITEWDNIMYTLHFYAATHKEDLRRTMENAIAGGLPVFVSEYSICDASGNGGIDETQAAAWVELLDKYKVSYVAWNLSNKNETSALIKSSCSKTSGLSKEDLSSTGEWLQGILAGENSSLQSGGFPGSLPENPLVGGNFSGNRGEGSQNRQPQDNQEQDGSGQDDRVPEGNQWQTGTADDLQAAIKLVNSWESNGTCFYQFEMTVENLSDKAIDGWSTEVTFNHEPELSDSWNGVYSLEGNTLHVSSVDYNGKLGSGESTGNIGFILSGEAGLSPQ